MGVLIPTLTNLALDRLPRFRAPSHGARQGQSASVLLEVVLALALFVGAATVISSGINASVQSAERIRLENHAADLAISILSEMQMGARPIAAIGPEPFEAPFQDWTFKIEIAQTEAAVEQAGSLRPVEVIIRHSHENVVQRLTQLFRGSEAGGNTNELSEALPPSL
ncbi:MAG TPA: hypothetical protein VK633_08850 [Verrucomicrobiae bacterium]|nr:hypothetical protein [Verrucomicrobiae bacterium]